MVIGQLPVYRGGRSAYRAPTGTPARRRKPLFSELDLHPGLSQLGAQPPALRRLLRTDLGVHGLRVVLPPSLDPVPHRLRNQPVGPRHLRDSPVLLDYLKDHLLLELTTESLCRHNQIIPHLSKQYSFHHCPRNTRHLTGRPLTSSHQHDHPAPSPAISRTTRTPSSSEHHAPDTVPPCPATRTPGPHCPRKTTHSSSRCRGRSRGASGPRRRLVWW